MTDDLNIGIQEVRLHDTPEIFFEDNMQEQEGVPFLVDPYQNLRRRYCEVREGLSKEDATINHDFFEMFHRTTGYFSLHKNADKMIQVGSIKTNDVIDTLEFLKDNHSELLESDLYFTVNTYYRAAKWRTRETHLPYPQRKEINLAYLNACYADIDVGRFFADDDEYKNYIDNPFHNKIYPYKVPPKNREEFIKSFHWEQALLQVMLLESAGVIPPVSIYAKSGRGIYLFWLLEPVKAFPEKITAYKAINGAINNDLTYCLPADKRALDAARILRVHGSSHSKSKTKVCYYPDVPCDEVKVYTLQELLDFYNLDLREDNSQNTIKTAKCKGQYPERANAIIAANENRFEDLKIIEKYMGGFPKGIRYTSLNYLMLFLRFAQCDEELILEVAEDFAARCSPPYPSRDEDNDIPLTEILKRVFSEDQKPILFKNSVLAKFWGIDKPTAERLNLCAIKPKGAKYTPPPTAHKEGVQERRKAIISLFRDKPLTPTECVKALAKDYGIESSRSTIKRELKKLDSEGEISLPKNPIGRPKKKRRGQS